MVNKPIVCHTVITPLLLVNRVCNNYYRVVADDTMGVKHCNTSVH